MHPNNQRRATAYLLVLVAVLVTVSIGVTGTMVHKARRERLSRAWEIERAHQIAQAGLELSVAYLQSDRSWRTLRGLGVWMNNAPLLDGTVTVTASDPDGSATDDHADDITLTSEGRFGKARQVVTATFTPIPVPMSSLAYASSTVGPTDFRGTINANRALAANGSMTAVGAAVRAPVYAGSSITGLIYYGTQHPNSGTREHPGATVFDWYIANGTAINHGSLPGGDLQQVVLGPGHNPWGAPNPLGIYVINCANKRIRIRNCRIEGTLVLLNPKSDSKIEQSLNWAPADSRLPALLVLGGMQIDISSTPITETAANTNLNPPTAPYLGSSDNDTSDSYPSQIEGLIYVSGNLIARGAAQIRGQVLAGGSATFSENVTLSWSSRYFDNPPPGFVSRYNMRLKTESLARVVGD